jgi:hypothetical protein
MNSHRNHVHTESSLIGGTDMNVVWRACMHAAAATAMATEHLVNSTCENPIRHQSRSHVGTHHDMCWSMWVNFNARLVRAAASVNSAFSMLLLRSPHEPLEIRFEE